MRCQLMLFSGLLFIALSGSAQSACDESANGYTIPAKEINCFRHFSSNQQPGVHAVNNYLLAKISQLMYTERLDFELRKLRNPSGFPAADFSSSQLNSSSNNSFECDFKKRFSHWFYDVNSKPVRPLKIDKNLQMAPVENRNKPGVVNNSNLKSNQMLNDKADLSGKARVIENKNTTTMSPEQKFIQDSIAFEKSKPKFKFLNKRTDFVNIGGEIRIPGFDPELMVISTEEYIIVAWRGTDNVYRDDSWEWIGTDAYFVPVSGDGPLASAKMHAGFWHSFKVIRNKLMATLDAFEAKSKNKKIFITGHSLGGGMAMISAPYLAGTGYKVAEVYTYAAPRVIGDQAFVNRCNTLLGSDKIQRFEYGVDFVTKLWSPAIYFSTYKIPGHRHWLNAQGVDDDYNCGERYFPMTANPFEYNDYSRAKIDKLNGDVGAFDPFGWAALFKTSIKGQSPKYPKESHSYPLFDFGQHNPQYYVKKAFENMTTEQKGLLPGFQDTYPYVYPAVPGNK